MISLKFLPRNIASNIPRNFRVLSTNNTIKYAVIRDIDDSLARDALSLNPSKRDSLDLALAKHQHSKHIEAIQRCGVSNIYNLPSNGGADSVFIEDTAVVIGDTVMLTTIGAKERRGETTAVKEFFQKQFPNKTMIEWKNNGTVDGGDVLYTGNSCLLPFFSHSCFLSRKRNYCW
jgi:N-dimethylarginine dimethylaminohydrolase